MSCPQWAELLAHRFEPRGDAPPGWGAAMRHLDGCPRCREEAVAIDPLLAFRDAEPVAVTPEEIAALRDDVRAVLRAESFPATEGRPGASRWAAAALVAASILLLPATTGTPPAGDGWLPAVIEAPATPAIDGLDRPSARIYEWGAEDLSVVMVVDETLDV